MTAEISELSARFDVDEFHLRPRDKIAYRGVSSSSDCEECGARQVETNGRSGSRKRARVVRTITGGPTLRLCTQHAEQWRDRDRYDANGPRR